MPTRGFAEEDFCLLMASDIRKARAIFNHYQRENPPSRAVSVSVADKISAPRAAAKILVR